MTSQRKRKALRKKQRLKIIVFVIEIILLLIVLAALYVSLKLAKLDTGNKLDEEKVQKNELKEETQEVLLKNTTIAIFGLDNRSNGYFESGNSDMIMLANIDEATKEVKIVSVYRDTYLDIAEEDGLFRKANAAFAYGGVEQAVSMLNKNLDLDIKDYVIVDFNAVVEAIDLLGGVEVEITDEEAYWMQQYIREVNRVTGNHSDYLYEGGVYNLDGVQATAYGRVRYTAGDDYKRTERQRLILEKMVEKALDSDLRTISSLIDELSDDIETSFTTTELIGLATDMFAYQLGENTGFPYDKITGDFDAAGDCVVPVTLESNVEQLHEFLFGADDYEPSWQVKELSEEIEERSGLGLEDLPES